MSVSVSAVPFILLFTVSKGIIELSKQSYSVNSFDENNIHIKEDFAEKLFNQEFETQILDKELLLKTIKEHGAMNIKDNDIEISCDCEAFHLSFYRMEINSPYYLKVSYNKENNLDEFVNDLGNEYTTNAQEVSYNKIKERLAKQNLEIEEEEIYEDNTIVLTVNLE